MVDVQTSHKPRTRTWLIASTASRSDVRPGTIVGRNATFPGNLCLGNVHTELVCPDHLIAVDVLMKPLRQITICRRSVADFRLPATKPFMRNDLEDGIMWTPYPRSNRMDYARKPALLRYIMVEMVDLTEILVEIQDLLFNRAPGWEQMISGNTPTPFIIGCCNGMIGYQRRLASTIVPCRRHCSCGKDCRPVFYERREKEVDKFAGCIITGLC